MVIIVASSSNQYFMSYLRFTGWYPELVFISVVFSNSTNLAVEILNSSVFEIYFVQQTLKNQFRDLSPPAKQTDNGWYPEVVFLTVVFF